MACKRSGVRIPLPPLFEIPDHRPLSCQFHPTCEPASACICWQCKGSGPRKQSREMTDRFFDLWIQNGPGSVGLSSLQQLLQQLVPTNINDDSSLRGLATV